ncbi:unnamed protein product [Urochloa humidicola]
MGHGELVRVDRDIIDELLARPKGEACGCYACLRGDAAFFAPLAEILEPEEVEAWRADYAAAAATFQKIHDQEDDILKQFLDKGYAVVEVDEEDEDEGGH